MNQIIHGDCVKEMRKLKLDSVDFIATDPPYGYSFMGKDWDKAVVGVETWKESLRVLKPGGFAFIMSAPRQDVLGKMIANLTDAGFKTDFTSLYWTYASGFPKAYNIAKGVEGKIKLGTANWSEWDRLDGEKGVRQMGYYKTNAEDGCRPNNYNGTERTTKVNLTTPEAIALDGSYGGFQPKPAVEVILVAMKPLSEKTYVDQALKNGKGVTWLDDCRIPTADKTPFPVGDYGDRGIYGTDGERTDDPHKSGRFPANLLVSDDVLNDGKVTKGAVSNGRKTDNSGYEKGWKPQEQAPSYADSGSYSRFFSLDSWAKTLPFLIVPKAAKSEKSRGLPEGMKASHPTTKPLTLMSYLITLGSREGDIVLDPFLGSGTTALAAKNLNRRYIGIEREEEYVKIARARLSATFKKKA